MKKNIIVGQSGGPTAVINASLYGVIKEGIAHPGEVLHVYGMIHGIEGFLSDQYCCLSSTLTPEALELLKLTPAAYLGSCRYKLPADFSSPVYSAIFQKFKALNIGCFFYIGGNDSMDTVSKLSRYAEQIGSEIRFIGVPKTIDNDLVETDHTPGFGSAAKYVASTVREIILDSSVYQQKSVTIVELMGRHAGWITAASVLARSHKLDNPLLIYLPESNFDLEDFANDVEKALIKNSNVIVCVSEGISDKNGRFICEYTDEAQVDTFGHKMLTGCGKMLENFIRSRFSIKVRSIELNVNQRCSGFLVSATDVAEASLAGSFSVSSALNGETGKMAAFQRISNSPYEIACVTIDVDGVCNKEKKFPKEWILKSGTDISDEFVQYVIPLIQGEEERVMQNGIPVFLCR